MSARGVRYTINGFFSHRAYDRWFSQPELSDESFKSKLYTTRARINLISAYAKLPHMLAYLLSCKYGNAWVKAEQKGGRKVRCEAGAMRCLLPSNAVSWAEMEWLQNVSIIVGKFWISQKPLGVESEWIFEVLLQVVHCPMVDTNDGLEGVLRLSVCSSSHCVVGLD